MKRKPVVCIGASLVDETYISLNPPLPGTSNPSMYYRTAGGVARNIAHHLSLLGNDVELLTHFGNDPDGKWLMEQCTSAGTSLRHVLIDETPTGRFTALLTPGGELFTGAVACAFEHLITPEFLIQKIPLLDSASLVLMDTNLNNQSLDWLLKFCRSRCIPAVIEPVSVPKASRLKHADLNDLLLITPNRDEILALTGEATQRGTPELIDALLNRGISYVWMRDGKNGSGIFARNYQTSLKAPAIEVNDTTGAGDAALAGWIHAWLSGRDARTCVAYGHAMAAIILQEKGAITNNLCSELLESMFLKINQTL